MNQPIKQRLALFLDGTWNTEDSSTNVLHAYHSTCEGIISEEKIIQKTYYDRGVGTGILDSITGGGLGLGLEVNVREAYNWLLANYNEGDEIYIFGFSRGAYTARSLVGLIASCGLVRRGAPLTLTQLWKAYCFISNNRAIKEDEWWKAALSKEKNKHYFRRLPQIKEETVINDAEKLILKWSRRVKITYLGIYDTVGAMGIHALGIPGLKSRLNEKHNLSPTSLLQNCRHALAIDEHRSSFRLTPILDYVENDASAEAIESYKNIIQQRWFVGAHSNIGGGYANNVLATRPYAWVLEGAIVAGLKLLDVSKQPSQTTAVVSQKKHIRDSYTELISFWGPHILREKRNNRSIGRADLVNAGHTLRSINEKIDESVFEFKKTNPDYAPPNLLAYLQQQPEKDKEQLFDKDKGGLEQQWPGELLFYNKAKKVSKQRNSARMLLLIWSLLAAYGTMNILQFIGAEGRSETVNFLQFIIGKTNSPIGLIFLTSLFVLIDWAEARTTLEVTFYPKAVIARVVWNIVYWFRWFGVLAFFIGLIDLLGICVDIAQKGAFTIQGIDFFFKYLLIGFLQMQNVLAIVSAAVLMFVLEKYWKKSFPKQEEKRILKLAPEILNAPVNTTTTEQHNDNKILLLIGGAIAVFLLALSLVQLWKKTPSIDHHISELPEKLLFIYLLIFILKSLFSWVDKPMRAPRANLGSILSLQYVVNNKQINQLFNFWIGKLRRNWISKEDRKTLGKIYAKEASRTLEQDRRMLAYLRLQEILRTVLWRDLLGFIPLYTTILGLILFIGAQSNYCYIAGMDCNRPLLGNGTNLWFLLIVFTAIADIAENSIHLRYIKNYLSGGSSPALMLLGAIATVCKFIGFLTVCFTSAVIVVFLIIGVLTDVGESPWRMVSVLISLLIIYVFVKYMIIKLFKFVYESAFAKKE